MYVLFSLDGKETIGLSDEIKPMTKAIYIENPENITKTVTQEYKEYTGKYIDINGVLSSIKTPFNAPHVRTIKKDILYTISAYPEIFTYNDVIDCRKKELLSANDGYSNCMIIETDFEELTDTESSSNIQTGTNNIVIEGTWFSKPLDIDGQKIRVIINSDNSSGYTLYIGQKTKFKRTAGDVKLTDEGPVTLKIKSKLIKSKEAERITVDAIFVLY